MSNIFIKVEENLVKNLLETQAEILKLLQEDSNVNNKDDDIYISLSEAGKIASMSYDFFYKEAKLGSFPTIYIGSALRVKKSDVLKFIKNM